MNGGKVTAAVLAGGGSTRMGRNKALLKLGDKTMIERVVDPLKDIFDDVLVVTNESENYNMLKDIKFVADCVDMGIKSSLIGLYSGLKQSKTSHIFVIGCDMPFVNTKLIKHMVDLLKNEDVIVPFTDADSVKCTVNLLRNEIAGDSSIGGYYQPLHAIYGKRCIPEFEKLLKKGRHKIAGIFEIVNVKKVMERDIRRFDPCMLCFENINTHEEYLQIMHHFE